MHLTKHFFLAYTTLPSSSCEMDEKLVYIQFMMLQNRNQDQSFAALVCQRDESLLVLAPVNWKIGCRWTKFAQKTLNPIWVMHSKITHINDEGLFLMFCFKKLFKLNNLDFFNKACSIYCFSSFHSLNWFDINNNLSIWIVSVTDWNWLFQNMKCLSSNVM